MALRSARVLEVLSIKFVRPVGRTPCCIHGHLGRFATRALRPVVLPGQERGPISYSGGAAFSRAELEIARSQPLRVSAERA